MVSDHPAKQADEQSKGDFSLTHSLSLSVILLSHLQA